MPRREMGLFFCMIIHENTTGYALRFLLMRKILHGGTME